MNDLKLDILEKAGDDIIEKLEPFSSDSEKTKKRILEMSEKKFEQLQNNSHIEEAQPEISVNGVERYRRPIWHKPLSAAAAVTVLLGGLGMFTLMNRSVVPQLNAPEIKTTEPDQTAAEPTTEPDQTAAEPTTEQDPSETQDLPSEEEMKETFDRLLPILYETESYNFHSNKHIDVNSDSMTIGDQVYYKINDPRYTSYSDLIDYYSQYFIDPTNVAFCYFDENDDLSGVVSDDGIYQVFEYEGELFASISFEGDISDRSDEEAISEKAYFVKDDFFIWERVIPDQESAEYGFDDAFDVQCIAFRKDDDGIWKIAYHSEITSSFSSEDLDSEFPLSFNFDEISSYSYIEFEKCFFSVMDQAFADYDYVDGFYVDETYELPDDIELMTDDYIHDDSYISFLTAKPIMKEYGRVVLRYFVDRNGTVFGKQEVPV